MYNHQNPLEVVSPFKTQVNSPNKSRHKKETSKEKRIKKDRIKNKLPNLIQLQPL